MAAPAGYTQVFSDDFNTLSVSANKTANANWYSGQAWGGGFGDAKLVSAASPNSPFSIVQQGGESALRIHMTRDANGQLQSGLISNTFPDGTSTTPHDGNPYGYYEARMWLPTGTGVWPGFWSIESERLSSNRGHVIETDVMENYGTAVPSQYSSAVHDWNWNGTVLLGQSTTNTRNTPGPDVVSSGWHTYGVQITPEKMTFYLDDHAYWSTPTPAGLDTDPMFMIDLAAGGGWTVDPNLKDASLYVDYFHAYEQDSSLYVVKTVAAQGATASIGGSVDAKVFALYEGLFGRAPDAAGAQAWASALNHGASLGDVARSLLASAEGQARLDPAAGNSAFVGQLYQSVLGRTADGPGLQSWTAQLDAGASRASVANAFVFSGEHLAQLQQSAASPAYLSVTTDAAVARLYEGLLNRAPDAAGFQAWQTAAHDGTPLAAIATSFLASPEYLAAHGSQTADQFVGSLYSAGLGRPLDDAGRQYWVAALSHGASQADVAVSILGSTEAQQHLASQAVYGLMTA